MPGLYGSLWYNLPVMTLKLIIFDLDGTLVDSSTDITIALNHAIAPFGMNLLTQEDTIKLIGEGITRVIEKLLASSGGDSASLADPADERRTLNIEGMHQQQVY
jgi:phosphoglycolate phosphatase-like HAD superfamily hydrolase